MDVMGWTIFSLTTPPSTNSSRMFPNGETYAHIEISGHPQRLRLAASVRFPYLYRMIVTRLDADARASIPAEVMDALGLKPGDRIAFNIVDGEVILHRFQSEEEIDEETGMTIGALRAFVAEGLDGPTIPMEEAFDQVRAHIDEVARRSNAA